jgi:hypothetical protein
MRPNDQLNDLCTGMLRRVEGAGEYSVVPFKPNIVYCGGQT